MPRITPFSINVAKPCHQNWEDMIPNGEGRHCNECSKTVVDFTNYSDAELVAYFSNLQGKVCGRFRASQLSRSLHIPPQPHSRLYRLTVALGLTLLFSQSTITFAQNKKERTTAYLLSGSTKEVGGEKGFGSLSGRVSVSLGYPVAEASVHFYRDGSYEKMVYTDVAGIYSVKNLRYGLYKVVIEAKGFEIASVDNVCVNTDSATVDPVVLSPYRTSRKRQTELIYTGEPEIDTLQMQKEVMDKSNHRRGRKKDHRSGQR
jgi:hypothetical protein